MDKTKGLIGKTLTRLGRSISHLNPARRLIFLAEPMFCLCFRRFAKFGEEM